MRLTFVLLFLVVSCASDRPDIATHQSTCNRISIDALFAEPFKFDNEEICTVGFVSDREAILLHPVPVIDDASYYDRVIHLNGDANFREFYTSIKANQEILVEGELSVPRRCWGPEERCSPFRKPLFLAVKKYSLASAR